MHYRRVIREALQAQIIAAATIAGANVFTGRARPILEILRKRESVVSIYTGDESAVRSADGQIYERSLTVSVELAAGGGDDLDDVLDAGMRKYTPYVAQCDALRDAQAALLRQIRTHVAAVHDDAALDATLQAQDAAYARVRDAYTTYTTLTQHVSEGHAFYARLAALLDTLRADVAAWRARAVPSGGAFPGGAIRFGD